MSQTYRPVGTKGLKVRVKTNAFAVEMDLTRVRSDTPKEYFHFDVIGKKGMPAPENGKSPLNTRRLYEIIDKFHTAYPQIFRGRRAAYDGRRNLYSPYDILEGQPLRVFEVMMGRRIRPDKPNAGIYNIRIERVAKVDLMTLNAVIQGQGGPSAQMAINLVQAMIRQAPMHATQTYNTRSIFHNQDTQPLGNTGLELWRGYFQSVRPSLGRMIINVDMSTAVVYKNISIIDFAMQYLGFRDVGQLVMMHPGSKEWKLLKSVLKGIRVITTVPPTDRQKNPRPIKDLIPQAGLYEFKIGNESWTVQQHFQKAHGYPMRFPKGWGIGFAGDAVVPPEVCVIIPGQLYRKKVPPANMKNVLDFSAKNPRDRLQIIEAGVNGSFLNYHQSDSLGLAGIQVSTSAMEIKGRMLDAPQVVYADGVLAKTVGKTGPGNWNLLRNQFFSPGRLVKWVVVNLAGAPQEAANFAVELLNACHALGMECQPAGAVIDGNPSNAWATLENTKKHLADPNNPKSPPLLVAVVLPDSAAELRRLVKLWGDSANGVPTQCVRRMKLRPINNQYINNVALKVNAKLGGVNSIARGPVSNLINQTPTMIIGADVSHPGPGVQRPSIASVVASYDPYLSKYSTFVTLQMPRREVIENLKSMIKRSFEVFGSRTGRMPAIVFYYRDGVSDGEYANVRNVEGKAIEEAYTEVAQQAGQTSTMKLIFITVGKRHHFRFFPTQHGSRDGSGNVPSGLVVDQDIADPRETDFYLQSQCGLKGTSRSSHYVVLRNDASVPMDDLQELSYMLCYNYARATKAVSIPAPVYYADLACERAGFYFDENLNFASEAGDSDGSTFDLNMWINGFKGIHRAMNTKLFFV